ncbi:unnamed protein product, partial [Rotaria socialis]
MKISDIFVQELDNLYDCLSESVNSMKFPRHSRDFVICFEQQVCLIKCIARHYLRLDQNEIRVIKYLNSSDGHSLISPEEEIQTEKQTGGIPTVHHS